jgi:hypothetical protein
MAFAIAGYERDLGLQRVSGSHGISFGPAFIDHTFAL